VQLKANETYVQQAEKRDRQLRKALEADRYAAVPTFEEDMPVTDEPDEDDELMEGAPVAGRTPRAPEAMGRGRIVPQATRPVQKSPSAGRQQPTRQSKSKRDKK
jgi:preprotein translocase subunit SecF